MPAIQAVRGKSAFLRQQSTFVQKKSSSETVNLLKSNTIKEMDERLLRVEEKQSSMEGTMEDILDVVS